MEKVFEEIKDFIMSIAIPSWNRLAKNVERQTEAMESLLRLAENAEKDRKEDLWHNASEDLIDCMKNGECSVTDRAKKLTVTFQFHDPNGNFVIVDYVIISEVQQAAVRNAVKTAEKDDRFQLKQTLIDIIGKRW